MLQALAYMKELKSKMSSDYNTKVSEPNVRCLMSTVSRQGRGISGLLQVSIPDAEYKAAVDMMAAEKTRYGLEDVAVCLASTS